MKICFTTSLFGDASTLDRPATFTRVDNCDYFLFTDITSNLESSWDVINLKNNKIINELSSSIKKSRYPKFLSWQILESMGFDYDVIFYCDASFYPNPNCDWYELSSQIINSSEIHFIQTVHQNPVVRNGGILAEMKLIIDHKRDSKESMIKTGKIFSDIDDTVNLQEPQYYENTCFGFSPKDAMVRKITDEFWKLYTKEEMSFRDQPLWNFLLLKNNIKPLVKNDFKYNTNNNKNDTSWFVFCPQNQGTMRNTYI